jgi:hypothetical protein
MARTAFALIAALSVIAAIPVATAANDVVQVRFISGLSHPNRSSEHLDLRIERVPATMAPQPQPQPQPIDKLFEAVKTVLDDSGISNDWSFVLPDGPYVEIQITIDGTRRTLASAHTLIEKDGRLVATERGAESLDGRDRRKVLSHQSPSFLRNRAAFERILSLVGEHVRNRIK